MVTAKPNVNLALANCMARCGIPSCPGNLLVCVARYVVILAAQLQHHWLTRPLWREKGCSGIIIRRPTINYLISETGIPSYMMAKTFIDRIVVILK